MSPSESTGPGGLIELLRRSEAYDDGEAVSLLAHGLQCASLLAGLAPTDVELQLAGLVHDLGWVLAPDDDAGHPAAGARLVRPLLGRRVAWLVARHVQAKRYLVAADPAYRDALSARSRQTLDVQGGPLGERSRRRLEAAPWIEELLMLRRADDEAKDPVRTVPGLDRWVPVLEDQIGQIGPVSARRRPPAPAGPPRS